MKLKELKYLTVSLDCFRTTGRIALTQWPPVYVENSNMQIGSFVQNLGRFLIKKFH